MDNQQDSSQDSYKESSMLDYVPPQEEIYSMAIDKNSFDWKKLLEEIIYKNHLDPFDIDISKLTKTYLHTIQDLNELDFAISGKLLTIAVFLLKKKAQYLVDHDISGIDDTLNSLQDFESEDFEAEFDSLENLDDVIEQKSRKKHNGDYKVKVRNPIARKRKVTLHDLISTLEKTFKQSNQRRKNFVLKNTDVEYEGPDYNKKKKDLKTIIEEIFNSLQQEFETKQSHVVFHKDVLRGDEKDKIDILHKFIPLLHLHNQEKITLKQKKHFNDIEIHKEE